MPVAKLTKRVVDAAVPSAKRYTVFDEQLKGFGLRVSPSGEKSWIVEYRPLGGGRSTSKKRITLGALGTLTPDQARKAAASILADVRLGRDPAQMRRDDRQSMTFSELTELFLSDHVALKRKAATEQQYRDLLQRLAVPSLGLKKAVTISRSDVAGLHSRLKVTPFQANRVLAVISAMYAFAARRGIVPEGFNPASHIEKYREHRRERFLTVEELERIGAALREAEKVGIEWEVDEDRTTSKHLAKPENRKTVLGPHAAAAIRLLILTGARLREILHLKWENVDFERALLLLPDSKTGQKSVLLSAPALSVLANLPRDGIFVIAGNDPEKPRADLQRPWKLIAKRAGLEGVRIHDLRHTYASVGAASGMGLPIIGKLLGHREAATTQRYAHLDNDPLRRANGAIGATLWAALGENTEQPGQLVSFEKKAAN